MTGLRRQLDDRSREVEQLTTLSLKGDATLQEYMAQLTVSVWRCVVGNHGHSSAFVMWHL